MHNYLQVLLPHHGPGCLSSKYCCLIGKPHFLPIYPTAAQQISGRTVTIMMLPGLEVFVGEALP